AVFEEASLVYLTGEAFCFCGLARSRRYSGERLYSVETRTIAPCEDKERRRYQIKAKIIHYWCFIRYNILKQVSFSNITVRKTE
ncbi:hypothetical protein, partial [Bacteroides acidifaciens]|uniref:hypothetical protein n=4 Tax=Bacteroides acidifaciens TaxID=85831 RepID=UPI0025708EEA